MKNLTIYLLFLLTLTFGSGCKKFLDEKPNKKLVVPNRMEDLQALMNSPNIAYFDPGMGEVMTTDYYLTDDDYNSLYQEFTKRAYIWEKDYVFDAGVNSNDWIRTYNLIYAANTVTEGLGNIDRNMANAADWDNIMGQAAFMRGKGFFGALQLWAPAYDKSSSNTDQGIPLRLKTDFNVPSVRASVEESYAQVISDLELAAAKLPVNSGHVKRPSKAAAYGMLSRVYMMMRDYSKAHLYADSCLALKNELLDFNALDSTLAFPVPLFNKEIVYDCTASWFYPLSMSMAKIAPDLYGSYDNNDLRKIIYFQDNGNGTFAFRGGYESSDDIWSGIAVDEILLNRAECYAREGNSEKSLQDLNTLLVKRWKNGSFVPYQASSVTNVLDLVLKERRKELLMRTIRWMDVKRLNKEGAGINFSRTVAGQTYQLPANDLRFALPIPEDVISLTGMPQNPR
jgi:tetratricopeptide (TPR) repeat protein